MSKLYKFGSDQNVVHFQTDSGDTFTLKMGFYNDINHHIDDYYDDLNPVDIYRCVLHQILCKKLHTSHFNVVYQNIYNEIIQIAQKCTNSESYQIYFNFSDENTKNIQKYTASDLNNFASHLHEQNAHNSNFQQFIFKIT